MEEAPENGKESSHSAHATGMNECNYTQYNIGTEIGHMLFSLIMQVLPVSQHQTHNKGLVYHETYLAYGTQ
jgi:hypothetical protein